MPELPEVERIRLDLAQQIVGARLSFLSLGPHRVVAILAQSPRSSKPAKRWATASDRVFDGEVVERLERRGKQLAVVCASGRVLVVRLGMSGQVLCDKAVDPSLKHVHIKWAFRAPGGRCGELAFRDPRRFGGIVVCNTLADASLLWTSMGPDALSVTTRLLALALKGRSSPLKVLLMDQSVIAGLGNIYVDEVLFRCRLHPLTKARLLRPSDLTLLARQIKAVLRRSIRLGGSTFRDYRRPDGSRGSFKDEHLVYGRAGKACTVCGREIARIRVAGRATAFCPNCQKER